jgi:hypothetical protein
MNIIKCDICKKTIKRGDKTMRVVPEGFLGGFEICHNCGQPVLKFLRSKKLIKEKPEKNGRK